MEITPEFESIFPEKKYPSKFISGKEIRENTKKKVLPKLLEALEEGIPYDVRRNTGKTPGNNKN